MNGLNELSAARVRIQYASMMLREAVLIAYETFYPDCPDALEVFAVTTLLGHLSLLFNNLEGVQELPLQELPLQELPLQELPLQALPLISKEKLKAANKTVNEFVNLLYQVLALDEGEFYVGDLEMNDVRMLEPSFLVANLSVCNLYINE